MYKTCLKAPFFPQNGKLLKVFPVLHLSERGDTEDKTTSGALINAWSARIITSKTRLADKKPKSILLSGSHKEVISLLQHSSGHLAQHRVGEISSLALHNHKSTAEHHWTPNLRVERERIKNIELVFNYTFPSQCLTMFGGISLSLN